MVSYVAPRLAEAVPLLRGALKAAGAAPGKIVVHLDPDTFECLLADEGIAGFFDITHRKDLTGRRPSLYFELNGVRFEQRQA